MAQALRIDARDDVATLLEDAVGDTAASVTLRLPREIATRKCPVTL